MTHTPTPPEHGATHLDDLGQKLACLAAFVEARGHARAPLTYQCGQCGLRLGRWIDRKRLAARRDRLTDSERHRLESAGFPWNAYLDSWRRYYGTLAEYVAEHGNALVPQRYTTSSGMKLGKWCADQRSACRNGTLSTERRELLNRLDFIWDPHQYRWEQFLRELQTYARNNGDARVPQHYRTSGGLLLGRRVHRLRAEYHAGRLDQATIATLVEHAFDFSRQPTHRELS